MAETLDMRATADQRAATDEDVAAIDRLRETVEQMKTEVARVIIGQQEVIERVLICIFARGHALLMGVPGLAKTLMIHALSDMMALKFSRIQFTPDLMPSDITGTDILQETDQPGRRQFEFVKGPIFANIVLADEINRTPPKTQAALLQAMQEHSVNAGSHAFRLEQPFFVLATQNPIEQEGTYPLPEAQLDRFMFLIKVDYPTEEEERRIAQETTGGAAAALRELINGETILAYQELVRRVPVPDHVYDHAVRLVRMTRPGARDHPVLDQGVGAVGRRPARGAVPGAGRQGPRGAPRQLPRADRGRERRRRPGAQPPHPHELPRGVRGHDQLGDHPAHGGRDLRGLSPAPARGTISWRASPTVRFSTRPSSAGWAASPSSRGGRCPAP